MLQVELVVMERKVELAEQAELVVMVLQVVLAV